MSTKDQREQIKQKRIMKYFIEATMEIIQNEGNEAVTIRKVANLAGYTSATLYNYFSNLNHLIYLANMHYLEDYNKTLLTCVADCKNPIEIYMAVCKCFSIHAYDNPETFILLFYSQKRGKYEEYTAQYYELYPEKETKHYPTVLDKMFHINNLHTRSFTMLLDCIEAGYIEKDKAMDFNDICLRFYKTILKDVKEGTLHKEEALDITLRYYNQLFGFYIKPEYKYILDQYYPKLTQAS